MDIVLIVIYTGALLLGCLPLSGVISRYRQVGQRLKRTQEFLLHYRTLVDSDGQENEVRLWLTQRSVEMQHDAESVGMGVALIAPPARMGGGAYQPHAMFADLFSQQTYIYVVTDQDRINTLNTITYELQKKQTRLRHELSNPLIWLLRTFERIVRFPRYVMKAAGFSERSTDSVFARAVTLIWGTAVGAAAIGSFVIALYK